MKKRLLASAVAVLLCSGFGAVSAQAPEDGPMARVSERDGGPDVQWFRDAKFGMFVHWGISSQTGGTFQGENYYGITEWLWRRSEASRDDYLALLDTFDPQGFNADEWVGLAKDAGAGYMVVTAKHHDGVAMFDTDASAYDVTDGSPFGRDPMKELAAAAEKQDVKLGFYYSQYQDWEHPHAGGNAWEYNEADQDFSIYQREKALPQLDELLTNYGDVALIWFDTPGNLTAEAAQDFMDFVRERQPNTLVSSRIGHGLGDYQNYRDSEIPVVHTSSRPFEAIFPHNESWGYSALDHNFKSTTTLLHILAEVASKGGNFLLNVGPDGNGEIPEESQRRFRAIGAWLNVNGEAIYQTIASPYAEMPWGAITQRPGRLYLHVLHPPMDGTILVPDNALDVERVRFLDGGRRLRAVRTEAGIEITLPDELPDTRNSVVVLQHDGGLVDSVSSDERRVLMISQQYEHFLLEPEIASRADGVEISNRRFWLNFGEWKHYPSVSGMISTADHLAWKLKILEPGEYRVVVHYSANEKQAGREAVVQIAGQDRIFRVLETGEFKSNRPVAILEHEVGNITIDQAGHYELRLAPAADGDSELMAFRQIELIPYD